MTITSILIGAAIVLIFAAVVIVRAAKRFENDDHWHHD
jgi:hypothetical protein